MDRQYAFPAMSLHASLRALWRASLDFLWPPLCLKCQRPTTEPDSLCPTCWKNIPFITPPLCAICGGPFEVPVEEGTLCGACLAEAPAFDGARAAFLYDDASKELILRLKHADQLHLVPALGAMLARAGAPFWKEADLIAPVPLHRWRLLRRRYNQAALLAQNVGQRTGKKVAPDLLVRTRATESQGHKNKTERKANVKKAFSLKKNFNIVGQTIVLIDDVMTSGSTLNACVEVLKKQGASKVYAVTLARTKTAN